MSDKKWSYSINYGPDGEEDWANLTTPDGQHVANIRTHHAMTIVAALNAAPSTAGRVERLETALRNALPAYEDWMDGHADDVKSATCRQLTFGELRAAYALLDGRSMTTLDRDVMVSLNSIIERVEAAQYSFERAPAAWNAFVTLRADLLALGDRS